MPLTLNSLSALQVIRSMRRKELLASPTDRCDILRADPAPQLRWSQRHLHEQLAFLRPVAEADELWPIYVLSPSRDGAPQMDGCIVTQCAKHLPSDSFIKVSDGVAISSPELAYIEAARVMDPVVHLLLGMELCGRFSRSAVKPRSGGVVYGLEPVTSVEKLRAYANSASSLWGTTKALENIDRIVENAWSPMEAIVAALFLLPPEELGYGLDPLALNPRADAKSEVLAITEKATRIPDLFFKGTSVGINYDGEDHFGLEAIAKTAARSALEPGNASLAREAKASLAEARQKIVADKRRDRDLSAMGLSVFPVTSEDLLERGGLDRVALLAIQAIEGEGSRHLARAKAAIASPILARARQNLIWSLLPGRISVDAARQLKRFMEGSSGNQELYRLSYEREDGTMRFIALDAV